MGGLHGARSDEPGVAREGRSSCAYAALEAGERIDPAAGLAFRLAAITGARRWELCALVYRDLDGDRLTIDSSIAIERTGSVSDRQVPALVDATTKTGNQRVVRLDERTVQAVETLRVQREQFVTAQPRSDEEVLMLRQLTVDFNRVIEGSLIRANARRAVPGTVLEVGSVIVVGDDGWGIVRAEVVEGFPPFGGEVAPDGFGVVVVPDFPPNGEALA